MFKYFTKILVKQDKEIQLSILKWRVSIANHGFISFFLLKLRCCCYQRINFCLEKFSNFKNLFFRLNFSNFQLMKMLKTVCGRLKNQWSDKSLEKLALMRKKCAPMKKKTHTERKEVNVKHVHSKLVTSITCWMLLLPLLNLFIIIHTEYIYWLYI